MDATIYDLPIISGILRRTNIGTERKSMVEAMGSIIKSTKTVFSLEMPRATGAALSRDPVIVIANHPSQAEVPLLMSALKKRNDVYLIASHHFLGILPSIDRYIIPVYISHRLDKKSDWKMRLFERFHKAEKFSHADAHQKNIESINMASNRVNEGGVVTIFPAAAEINNQFMPGVGYLIEGVEDRKKTKIVMAYIDGTSTWDYLRIIPFVRKFLPKLKVNFSKPISINEIIGGGAKAVTKKLEERYYNWVRTL